MPDDVPVLRQWKLLRILSVRKYGVTVREMAQEMGVGEKTIRRDLAQFRDLGFPLQEEVGEFGRKTWKLDQSRQLPLICRFDEAVALHMARQFLEPLAGTHIGEAANSVFRKLSASFNERTLEYLGRFHGLFHHVTRGAVDYSKKGSLIDDLSMAMEEQRATHITYQSTQATEPVTRDVYPYSFLYYRHALYLDAHDPNHGQVRTYKVDRIEEVDVSNVHFQKPADYDATKYLKGSFGIFHGDGDFNIVVRFLQPVARYVRERLWHESAIYEPQRDGSIHARFRLSTLEEFKTWVLSFGANAIVLEPASFRDRIARELEAMLEHYRGQPAKRS